MVSNVIRETDKVINEFVKFENVLITYDTGNNFEVEFSLDKSVKGSSKDWIGIFKGGWNSYESFLAHEYALGMPCDETGRRRKVRFLAKYIQHAKPGVPYQFVYINKYLEIMGVSQYFKFMNSKMSSSLLDNTVCESSFSPNLRSSPVSKSNLNSEDSENKGHNNIENGRAITASIGLTPNALHTNCKLYSVSKWKDNCTTCYQCRDIFQMKASNDELLKKVKLYEDYNFALQDKVNQLERWLKWEWSNANGYLKRCILHITEAAENNISSSVNGSDDEKGVKALGCFDWDLSSKELHLKAVIGHQELTIRDLKKVICELGYIDRPKLCHQPSISLQDTVRKIRAQERIIAEIYDINNNTSEEIEKNLFYIPQLPL